MSIRVPWRRRWIAVVVGEESGNVTRLPFVTFRRQRAGLDWVARMNETAGMTVHFELRPIGAGDA